MESWYHSSTKCRFQKQHCLFFSGRQLPIPCNKSAAVAGLNHWLCVPQGWRKSLWPSRFLGCTGHCHSIQSTLHTVSKQNQPWPNLTSLRRALLLWLRYPGPHTCASCAGVVPSITIFGKILVLLEVDKFHSKDTLSFLKGMQILEKYCVG